MLKEELSRASEIDDTLLNKMKAVSKMADYYDHVADDNDLAVKMKGKYKRTLCVCIDE